MAFAQRNPIIILIKKLSIEVIVAYAADIAEVYEVCIVDKSSCEVVEVLQEVEFCISYTNKLPENIIVNVKRY